MIRKTPVLTSLVIALSLLLLFTGCPKKDTNPVAPGTDDSNYRPGYTDQNPVTYYLADPQGGGPFVLSPSALIDHTNPQTWIYINFEGRMDPSNVDIKVTNVSTGGDLALEFVWSIGGVSTLILKPTANLTVNATYALQVNAAGTKDVAGNMLDFDGDNVGGESPDDNLVERFTTHRDGDEFIDIDYDSVYDNIQDLDLNHYFSDGNIAEPFWDVVPYNAKYDAGVDSFVDLNDNNVYDAGERYDDNNGNQQFDDGEDFQDDVNYNGWCDLGEFFVDSDVDSIWDAAEPYTDENNNGEYDYTELRLDMNANGVYDYGDGDTYVDIETPNGRCDYAEPFDNLDGDSTIITGHVDSTGASIYVRHWDDEEPVYPGYDYDNDGEYDPCVTPSTAEPWDPASAPTKTVFYNGNVEPVTFNGYSELFTDENNDGIWNWPDAWFWTDAISNGVYDTQGEQLTIDMDSDGNYDEPEDGTPVAQTDDDLNPFAGGLQYLIGDQVVSTIWIDVSLGVYVLDETYDVLGNIDTTAVNASTVDSNTVLLREDNSGISVSGTVTYDNVAASPYFGRVTFNPSDNLKTRTAYILTLKGTIADAAGNKLNPTGDIEYTFITSDRTSGGAGYDPDIIPPGVYSLNDLGNAFMVVFTELIDPTTICASTIYLINGGIKVNGSLEIGTTYDPGQLATTVIFTPYDPSITSGDVYVTGEIKDLSNNIMGTTWTGNW